MVAQAGMEADQVHEHEPRGGPDAVRLYRGYGVVSYIGKVCLIGHQVGDDEECCEQIGCSSILALM